MKKLLVLLFAVLLLLPRLFFAAAEEPAGEEDESIDFPRPEGTVVQTPLGDRELLADADWTPELADEEAEPQQLLLLGTARGELGYVEQTVGRSAYSKYGDWMGTPYSEWCSEFVTWCVAMTDEQHGTSLLNDVYPYVGTSHGQVDWYIKRGRYVSSDGRLKTSSGSLQWWPTTGEYLQKDEYIPYPGDLLWLYTPGFNKDRASHVALVEGVSLAKDGSVTVHVIEGNMPDRVQRATYQLNDSSLLGFGTPRSLVGTESKLYNHRDDVITVKGWLKELGYYTSSDMSDYFTPALVKAVKRFQTDRQLSRSGAMDMETRMALEDAEKGY